MSADLSGHRRSFRPYDRHVAGSIGDGVDRHCPIQDRVDLARWEESQIKHHPDLPLTSTSTFGDL